MPLSIALLFLAQDPVIRVSSRLVEIGVVATDRQGAVGGLRRDDFRLFDGKTERKIQVFSVHRADSGPARPPLPPGLRTNRSVRFGTPGTATVLLLDSLNTPFADQAAARRRILDFLAAIAPGDRVAVYSLGRELTVLQDFTDDPKALVEVVEKARAAYSAPLAASSRDRPETNNSAVDRFLETMSQRVADFAVVERARLTMAAIESIARHAAWIPGRKNLVWVSGGFPIALNRLPDELLPELSRHARDLSEETGGRAFLNTNDAAGALRQAVADAAVGYTLGFYLPESEADSRFHAIKVTVSRPGVEVRHPAGYFADKDAPFDARRASAELSMALSGPLESAAIHVVGGLLPGESAGERTLRVFVEPAHIRIAEDAGRWRASLVFTVAQLSAGGKTLSARSETMNLNLTAAQFAALQKDGVMLGKPVAIESGAAQVRFAVLDRATGRTGSLFLPVTPR